MVLQDGTLGVLDFQDAGIGPVAYDIASLCEQVRRDGGPVLLNDMLAYYYAQAKPPMPLPHLMRAAHILSAQRHLRILGIIAQLAQKSGRRDKLDYLPRIWQHLNIVMQEDGLQPVKRWITSLHIQ
jgi:aminoglycoside/choline kinase family phosphotransferase